MPKIEDLLITLLPSRHLICVVFKLAGVTFGSNPNGYLLVDLSELFIILKQGLFRM